MVGPLGPTGGLTKFDRSGSPPVGVTLGIRAPPPFKREQQNLLNFLRHGSPLERQYRGRTGGGGTNRKARVSQKGPSGGLCAVF